MNITRYKPAILNLQWERVWAFLKIALTWAFALGLAALLGFLVAWAPAPTGVLFGAVVIGLFLVFGLPAYFLCTLLVVLTLAIVGPLESLARVPKVFWIPYLLALVLAFKALLTVKAQSRTKSAASQNLASNGVLKFIAATFVVLTLVGVLVNASDPMQVILASRDYFWLSGLLALVLAARISADKVISWLQIFPWLIVIQAPLVIYQHFFLAKSTSFTTHDAVVGLFGGNPETGGASGAMGMFSLIVAIYAVVRMQNGLMRYLFGLTVILCALLAIGLAEVKFVVLVAPVVLLAFLGLKEIFRRPSAVLWLAGLVLMTPVLLFGYWKMFTPVGAKAYGSFDKYVTLIIENNLDSTIIGPTGEMGRVTALKFWAQESAKEANPLTMALGHGIGSSRIGAFPGEVAVRYRFNIAKSSMTVLLWETGLIGLSLVVSLLIAGIAFANRVQKKLSPELKEQKISCRFAVAVFCIGLLGLPYNTDLIGTSQFQLLVVMAFTILMVLARQAAARSGVKQ